LCGNDTTFPQCAIKQFKVGLLEKGFSGALGVAGVGDDDVELVLLVLKEFEAVADNDLDVGVLEAERHARKVLLGQTNNGLVNITKDSLLDTIVLDDLTEYAAVAAANDQNALRVGVRVHGQVGDHLLVAVPRQSSLASAVV
jgi:hypothetical protein